MFSSSLKWPGHMWTITWKSLATRSPMSVLSWATSRPWQKRVWIRAHSISLCKRSFLSLVLSLYVVFECCVVCRETVLKCWFSATVPTVWWISLQTRGECWLKPTVCSRYAVFHLSFLVSLSSHISQYMTRMLWQKAKTSMLFALIFTMYAVWLLIFRTVVSCTSVTSTAVQD